jgi:Domain of unknown function (DUF4412)
VKRTLFLLAALSLAAASASAQFEGVADFKLTTGKERDGAATGTGKMFIAAGGYRMDWEMSIASGKDGGKSAGRAPAQIMMTILGRKSEPGKVYMLNDAQKTYSVMDAEKAADLKNATPKDTFTVQKLGTDKVAGLSCQNALLTSSKGTEIEVCVTKEIAAPVDWLAGMRRQNPEGASWMSALKEKGFDGFPVRWVIRKKGSTDALATMEMTHIEKKSVPSSVFEIPAGYKQTQFAMGGMTPEQQKAMAQALEHMTPEQRKAYADAMKRYGQPTPTP